jgi:hypothetical protein
MEGGIRLQLDGIDRLLLSLQDSALAQWAQSSAYPVIITLHAIGLAMLVGLLTVIDLRVLGFARQLPLPALRQLMKVVWIGFWINAVSGALLFCVDARKDFHSDLFRIKLTVIAIGLILANLIESRVLRVTAAGAPCAIPLAARTKFLALMSLLCWTMAIVSGRLLAYSTFGDVGVE